MIRLAFRSLAIGALALAAAAPPSTAQEATFVLAPGDLGATGLDPIAGLKLNLGVWLIHDRLVAKDADQSYHPHLAESWEESADGLTWTFRLKPGVTFHDGEPFNADTIAWWIPKYVGTENEFMVAAIKDVEVVDDLTVRLHMSRPEPNLLYNMASSFMSIPSPKAWEALGADYGVTGAVGTGPYTLESFTLGLETVLARNDAYAWASELSANQGPPKLARLTLREIADQSTAFLELKTGGVDLLLGVPTDFLDILKAEADVRVISMPGTGVMYMPMNTTAAPLDDIRVREAVAKAVDQAAIAANIFGGVGAPAHHFLIDALPEAQVAPALLISHDPARAMAALDEAGWTAGADGKRARDGEPLVLKLWSESGTELNRVTQVVQAQLKAVGVDSEIRLFDSNAVRDLYRANEHQLAVRSYDWDNSDILDWFFSGARLGYPNVSMWTDATAQAMNDAAMTASATSAERVANFKAYHEYALSQFVFAPIYQPTINVAYSTSRLEVPEVVRGSRFTAQTVLDIGPAR